MDRLRCRMPMPPSRAMAMAMRDSVTVSMALESSGVATEMRRVIREEVSASLGMTSVCPGRRRTSSYVSPTKPKGSCCSMDDPPAGESVARAGKPRSEDSKRLRLRKIPPIRRSTSQSRPLHSTLRPSHGRPVVAASTHRGGCVGPTSTAVRRARPWLIAVLGMLMALSLLVLQPPASALADETDDGQEITDFYFAGVITFDDEPVPDVTVTIEGNGFESATETDADG